jgi:hypothetical protein
MHRSGISESNWKPILDALVETVDRFPDSREKRMAKLYIEELYYRFWHHKLGPECTCTDIDFVEYKIVGDNPEILALIEIKTSGSSMTRVGIPWQTRIEKVIAEKLNVPLFRVTFNNDLTQFLLEGIQPAQKPRLLNESEYILFHRRELRGLI